MTFVRSLARWVPIRIPIAGRQRDRIFGKLDAAFKFTTKGDTLATPYGTLSLDWTHEPERLLSYLYHNVLAYYEQSELGVYMRRVAEPGSVFVDVGANLGMYSLVARGHGFETVVVEPEPKHAAFLQRNAAVFGRVLAVAVSDAPGTLPLYYEAGNSGSTSLFTSSHYAKGQSVEVTTLSDLASAGSLGNLAKLRLLKIDVEGFEAQVVRGMRGLLESGARPHIWCEVRGDASGRNGGSYRNVRETLKGFGYRMQRLRNGRELNERETQLAQKAVFDALFTLDGAE